MKQNSITKDENEQSTPAFAKLPVSRSNEIDTRMEIVEIDEKFSVHFIYVPDGYNITSHKISEHKTQVIGRLKQFNRLKCISTWKQDHKDLVAFFSEILEKRGWDFRQFPNPIAVGVYYCG